MNARTLRVRPPASHRLARRYRARGTHDSAGTRQVNVPSQQVRAVPHSRAVAAGGVTAAGGGYPPRQLRLPLTPPLRTLTYRRTNSMLPQLAARRNEHAAPPSRSERNGG